MSHPWESWDYITKIDLDEDLVDGGTFEDVCETGTGALEISDTLDITEEETERVIETTPKYDVSIYQESSSPGIVIGDDVLGGYLTPMVFNTSDSLWITGAHKERVRIEDGLDWDRTHTEAYIVLSPESSVVEYTDADTNQFTEDVASFARVAEKMFDQKIIYIEYSGIYDDPEKVGATHDALGDVTPSYGSGIHGYESARGVGQHMNVVVAGNLLHDESVDAVRKTVEDMKDVTVEFVAE